jgi:ubiquinone biosynthesis protein
MVELSVHKNSHAGRYRQITQVLAKQGLGYLINVLGLARFLPFHQSLLGLPSRTEPYTRPEHVRMALEELGATYIKLGQILSTRADLLPPEYQSELIKLQDHAPLVPSASIQAVIEQELKASIHEVYAAFDTEPLAAASIGQAHAAVLHDGTEVVIKVRRPGVVEQIEEDLDILENLATAAATHWEFADRYDVVGLMEEFSRTLRTELNYIQEAQHAEQFAKNFRNDDKVHIPKIFWQATTSRVLTMERIRGLKITDRTGLEAQNIDCPVLAEGATGVVLKMIFEDGFYHADPHPGNFFIEKGGRIGIIDFGMVGTVDEPTKEQLVSLLFAITAKDSGRLVDILLEFGTTGNSVNKDKLGRDLNHLLSRYYGQSLGELSLSSLLNEIFLIIRTHNLHLPPNLVLLIKTLAMSEGIGAQLDPTFHITAVLAPYAQRLLLKQYAPSVWVKKVKQASLDFARFGVEMPQQLSRLILDIERGGLEVGMRPQGFEPIIRRLERLVNRLVFGVIAAAFIVGLAILLSVYHPPGWERWASLFFAFGFFVAATLGLYLAWSILRSK